MPKSLRVVFCAVAMSLIAPVAMHAQGCPPGYTMTNGAGGSFSCTPNAPSAPEIGMSSGVTGFAVLLGGGLMLRGSKRRTRLSQTA